MLELNEQEKTILELFKTNGHKGVHQYLVHEGMTDDEAETKISTLEYLIPKSENIENVQTILSNSPHKETVTFIDGSTHEIDVLADGTVVNPIIPTTMYEGWKDSQDNIQTIVEDNEIVQVGNVDKSKTFLDKVKNAVGL